MNLNKGCIEIIVALDVADGTLKMNLNKGCIEIIKVWVDETQNIEMNLNKGCIEIRPSVIISDDMQG